MPAEGGGAFCVAVQAAVHDTRHRVSLVFGLDSCSCTVQIGVPFALFVTTPDEQDELDAAHVKLAKAFAATARMLYRAHNGADAPLTSTAAHGMVRACHDARRVLTHALRDCPPSIATTPLARSLFEVDYTLSQPDPFKS